jgi:hypothetical protein
MSGLPLGADELALVFGYANRRGVNRAIRLDIFPVPTYKHNGHYFAHADHVNLWLEEKKQEAELAWMDEG